MLRFCLQPYEVTTEGSLPTEYAPAQISLTDCLACSGCVTSAEAVLVSLQSHAEVLNALDQSADQKVFVASVSPQVRASLAVTYGISEPEAGWLIDQLLGGPKGLASGGIYNNCFTWIVDTNAMREASLILGADEVTKSLSTLNTEQVSSDSTSSTTTPRKPIISSACPGWICYAEKTHPHVLPHLSCLKSPQALTGTLLKSVLSQRLDMHPGNIFHVAIMPCFDKKLEASREELTDIYWRPPPSTTAAKAPIRDVDCVITARELIMLADTRGISFPDLPRKPLPASTHPPFPDPIISSFLFPSNHRQRAQTPAAGTSGGYLHHILQTKLALHPSSTLTMTRGRNVDVVEYAIDIPTSATPIFKAARYYGSRNIQNLVRKLKPAKKSRIPGARPGPRTAGQRMDADYVEVMACPGGCTNGGGQVKVDDVGLQITQGIGQKQWLEKVDEAYYSMSESEGESGGDDKPMTNSSDGPLDRSDAPSDIVNGISPSYIKWVLDHWAASTGIELQKLVTTTYRKVESEVGKAGGAENEHVVELAGKIGGGW